MSDPTHEIEGLQAHYSDEGEPHCFYCGVLLGSGRIEFDHFPLPRVLGGDKTVPSCHACHDLKDRRPLVDWPLETFGAAMAELLHAGPHARILLAKALTIAIAAEVREAAAAGDG